MIYYFCYDNAKPTGGNKITYRHVEILNQQGIPACIVHQGADFKYTQFSHCPPTIGLADLRLRSEDLFVLPEDLGPALNTIAPGVKKVIFNQNAYSSFRGYKLFDKQSPPYLHPDTLVTLVVSEDNKRDLETAFPGLACFRLRISFRQDVFSCGDLSQKKKQLCFMTRKNPSDVVQVIAQLRQRGRMQGWRFVALENASEQQVADAMRESALFLSFGHPEGISLSNIEAMASCSLVVGYSGMGCREYFDPGYCLEVPFGDIAQFVVAAEKAAHLFDAERSDYDAHVLRSQAYAMTTFSPQNELDDLKQLYGGILRKKGFLAS